MSIAILICLLPALSLAATASAQATVQLDLSEGWLRRDWDECRDPTTMRSTEDFMEIETNRSAALYWQIPTVSGPVEIDTSQDWVRECDRPPRDFARVVSEGDRRSDLLDAKEYRYFTWRWNVTGTIDDDRTVDASGRIRHEGDDFAAKIGISILREGTDDLREISYVWTRSIEEDRVLVQERRVLFWKFQYHRIVAESGEENVGRWVPEARDLYADYKRIYPDEEPGRIVRIYVMSDSDNTRSRVTGRFADLSFSTERPERLSSSR